MFHPTEEQVDELINIKLVNKNSLKKSFFAKRRAEISSLEEYEIRTKKMKQNECQVPKFDEMSCPICLDVFQKVTTTVCGHAFCEMCLFDSLIRKAECPVCRVKIRSHQFQYCSSFDNRVEHLVRLYGDENQKEQFRRRTNERSEWNQNKRIDQIQVDQKIDIMDSQFVWCVGIVKQVNDQELFIHYDGWDQAYDEFVPRNSLRIAPHGFYTSRTDIPKYELEQSLTIDDFFRLVLEHSLYQPSNFFNYVTTGYNDG